MAHSLRSEVTAGVCRRDRTVVIEIAAHMDSAVAYRLPNATALRVAPQPTAMRPTSQGTTRRATCPVIRIDLPPATAGCLAALYAGASLI